MTDSAFAAGQVHRFRGWVSAHIRPVQGNGATVYMEPGEARAIAAALLACAEDVERLPFTESTVGTARIEAGATPPPDALARIRAAVKAHDDRLNDDEKPGGATSPTGDDYNDVFALIMDGAPADPLRDSAPELLRLVKRLRETAEWLARKRRSDGDEEGARLNEMFIALEVDPAIAAAEGREG